MVIIKIYVRLKQEYNLKNIFKLFQSLQIKWIKNEDEIELTKHMKIRQEPERDPF